MQAKERNVWNIMLNLVSMCLIAYLCTSMVMRYRDSHIKAHSGTLQLGQPVPIRAEWQKSHRTLVFVLQQGCHFCAESVPFYRELLNRQNPSDWQTIAVLPQPVDQAGTYLHTQGLYIPVIRQVDFGALGVSATPTLLLVDGQGRLQQEWIGKLTESEQNDVAMHLGIGKLAQTGNNKQNEYSPLVMTSDFLEMLRIKRPINLVDTRDRNEYAHSHIEASRNIPLDELEVRAEREMAPDLQTIVYCDYSPSCATSSPNNRCSTAAEFLAKAGFTNVRILRDRLRLLEEAGVPVTGSHIPREMTSLVHSREP